MSHECVRVSVFARTVSMCAQKPVQHNCLTRPTGDDAMSVKQGFLLEQQNILYFSFM